VLRLRTARRGPVFGQDFLEAVSAEGLAAPPRTRITEDQSVTAVDIWEGAGFREEEARNRAKAAKSAYEDSLRRVNFHS
jgi:hypothetical protein